MVSESRLFIKCAAAVTLLADMSLVFRRGFIKPYTLQPFECLVLIAAVFFALGMLIAPKDQRPKFHLKMYSLPFLIAGIFITIGTLSAFTLFPVTREVVLSTIKDVFLLCCIFIAFILHLYFGRNADFRKRVLYSLCFSLALFVFLPFPSLANQMNLIGNGNSLVGLHTNQNDFSSLLLIPFSCLLILTLQEKVASKKIRYYIPLILCSALLLWTGSRGSWVASIIIVMLMGTVHVYRTYKTALIRATKLGILIATSVVTLLASYLILPHPTKIMILDRFFPSITGGMINPAVLKTTTLRDALARSKQSQGSIPYQNRQNIWPQALELLKNNPAGLGLEYARSSQALHESDGRWTLSHNTLLQAALVGGIPLLLCALFGIAYITSILIPLAKDAEGLLYASVFAGLLITMQFNDYLIALPWFWIIIAMIVAKKEQQGLVLS